MSEELSVDEKARRVAKFRRIVGYRKVAGFLFAIVGAGLLVVGLQENKPLVALNGAMFGGYGVYMVIQSKRAMQKLGG